MAAPTSTNEVTARRLASVISQLWSKIKETFAAKSHSHQISDVTDLQDSIDSRMSKDGTNSTTDSLANIITKGDYYTKDSFPSTSGYIAQVGLSFRNSSTNTNKTIRMNLNDFEGKLKDDIGAWPTASAAASGSALETAINNKLSTSDFESSPAGNIIVLDPSSTTYTYEQVVAWFNAGKHIFLKAGGFYYTLMGYGNMPAQAQHNGVLFAMPMYARGNYQYVAWLRDDNQWVGPYTESITGFAATNHSHSADEVTSGTFDTARIPNLSASKINSGTLDSARIPNLDASKITSGTFPDSRIASADIWNSKQDATSFNDGGRVWEDSCVSGYAYKIGFPTGQTSYATIVCHASTKNGWPIIFLIGYNWGGSEFVTNCTPKVSILYSTEHSVVDNMIYVKYSEGNKAIYINFGCGIDHRLSFTMSSKRSASYTFSSVSNTSSEYTGATSTPTSNLEGCVMKTNVGTAIGNNSTPVYVNSSGFVKACTSINAASSDDADKVDGWHVNVNGSSSGSGGTIYFA